MEKSFEIVDGRLNDGRARLPIIQALPQHSAQVSLEIHTNPRTHRMHAIESPVFIHVRSLAFDT